MRLRISRVHTRACRFFPQAFIQHFLRDSRREAFAQDWTPTLDCGSTWELFSHLGCQEDRVRIGTGSCAYQKPHTHGLRDRSRGPRPAHDHQRRHGRRALCGSRRSVGVLRTFLRPPRQRARSSGAGHPWLRSGRLSMVAVMQAAHVRPRDDLARGRRLDGATHRRILTQRQMRAPVMVVVDVRSQYALQ